MTLVCSLLMQPKSNYQSRYSRHFANVIRSMDKSGGAAGSPATGGIPRGASWSRWEDLVVARPVEGTHGR